MTEEAHIPEWTLGDRLAKAREHADISVGDMARRLRISRTTISNYEHGRTDPSLATLMAWSQITHVPLWWLLDDEEPTLRAAIGGYTSTYPFIRSPVRLRLVS